MGLHIRAGQKVELQYCSSESEAVKTAIRNLAKDLGKVLPGVEVCLREETAGEVSFDGEDGSAGRACFAGQGAAEVSSVIVIETLEEQRDACAYDPEQGSAGKDSVRENRAEKNFAAQDNDAQTQKCMVRHHMNQVIDRKQLTDENGLLRREAFQLKVQDGRLYIAGVGRRGTIYGIYTFCEWMGVSPWYFFADVPVRERQELTLEEGYCLTDWPSVEYRGIFINDEEELEAWVQNYMDEPTIGVKSYERIFELLLRLKANYIWPAMHVNSFNLAPENGALADRMGIVVGTSHCDMLMRSNNREWKPWIREKGYTDAVYDYSIEGRNRDILKEYWRESVEQNREYEVCYTLGMRGIHDSGFETKDLEGGTEEEIRHAKIELLGKIIADQREILRDTLGHETMMTFIPYKEVLELYDNGLKVPEDMTLVWANDNYGHIRRYPSEAEKMRKGGNGIYYHNSYWSPPSMSYVFLCSIPLAHTGNELRKAWDQGIRKLWVLNSGAMKPLEQEITFFLRLAWEIGKPGAVTEDVEAFVEDWIDRTFTGKIGKQVSGLLNDFSQLTNVRKLENMDHDAFSQTAYGDEAAMRIHRYEELFAKGNELYGKLPEEERDAFFQLVLMRIHAAYFTNLSYYYGDRSTLMYDRGNCQGAAFYTERSREAEDAVRRLLHYYNRVMCGGKWNGILNPEGFPPPRAAMMPVCTPPLERCAGFLWDRKENSGTEGDESFLAERNGDAKAGKGGSLTVERNGDPAAGKGGSLSAERNGDPRIKTDRRPFQKPDEGFPMDIYIWNEEKELCFVTPGEKWIEIGNTGSGEFEVSLHGPEWVTLSAERAVICWEKRILVSVTDPWERREGEIVIENVRDGSSRRIPVRTAGAKCVKAHGDPESRRETECVSGRRVESDDDPESRGEAHGEPESCGDMECLTADPAEANGTAGDCERTGCAEEGCTESAWALEEDGLVALEAVCAQSGLGYSGDFKVIPRLGRMQGSLVEAQVQREPTEGQIESAVPLCYPFATESRGGFLLEIHRFPSLNSVGRIRIGVSLDDGPVQIVESPSNDEWRGNWKENVLNNVDRLPLRLSVTEPGMHRLYLWAVDRYFAFSRMVIYTRPRKENNLAGIRGPQPLPEERKLLSWCDDFYGKCDLLPRTVYYAAPENIEDSIAITCQAVQAKQYGEKVEPDWYRQRGSSVFEEISGAVRIDAAAALAQSDFAWMDSGAENPAPAGSLSRNDCAETGNGTESTVPVQAWNHSGCVGKGDGAESTASEQALFRVHCVGTRDSLLWRHCRSESFGRSGLALYIRTPRSGWREQDAPSLNYRFACEGGKYTLWMLSKFNVREEGFFAVGFDEERIPVERLYGKGSLWRYEAEQIYRWVPVTQTELTAGEHVLRMYALAAGMRYDRFYLTRGEELPPMDQEWLPPTEG